MSIKINDIVIEDNREVNKKNYQNPNGHRFTLMSK